ncbi:hypothetical protein [Nocardia huaxiensis]|uniref:DUF485 domain-containing protein n=1 Tax=Nocardia huaxiensis TaxID=2755382 RepID=A0A7D6ZND0_9NOCA|nr:hypothetical protein [Nocardia huaxiensis]QLY34767.1 hypothetical protein H0264_30095 [Nocardia huaxiensis]UFS96974.1 hypothetical protein LPY97_03295 [Nocardia huaxiensis]
MVGPQRVVRERVVLAERRGARMVRTQVEVAEQTEIGEALISGLIRAQFGLAVRVGLIVLAVVAALPVLFAVDIVRRAMVFGVPVPWLVLGVLAAPLLYAAGRVYVRLADRNEQDFAALAED